MVARSGDSRPADARLRGVGRGASALDRPLRGTALPLLAESETRFFNRDINVVVEFVRDGAGNVAELVVLQGTHQERATRAK